MEVLLGIYQAFWRRLFGGWLGNIPIIKERWFQHVINCLILAAAMFFTGVIWWKIICSLIIIECFFWGKGHGCYFDLGHSILDEKMLERYCNAWGYKIACKIFPESEWYGYWFDAFLMYVRYGLPSIALIPFVGWHAAVAGFVGGAGYQLGWWLQDRGCKFFKNNFCDSATMLGEIIAGFSLGFFLFV